MRTLDADFERVEGQTDGMKSRSSETAVSKTQWLLRCIYPIPCFIALGRIICIGKLWMRKGGSDSSSGSFSVLSAVEMKDSTRVSLDFDSFSSQNVRTKFVSLVFSSWKEPAQLQWRRHRPLNRVRTSSIRSQSHSLLPSVFDPNMTLEVYLGRTFLRGNRITGQESAKKWKRSCPLPPLPFLMLRLPQ